MATKLFQPYQLKNIMLKNRIVMSPMCMYSSDQTGLVKDWHLHHYAARSIGQVGMVMIEATGVTAQGRISERDLGIWEDGQIEGLQTLVNTIKENGGAVTAIQLAHAGRKATVSGEIVSCSEIPFSGDAKTPKQLTIAEINDVVIAFQSAAKRAKLAGFDVIELHGAHGYLINQFLSPLSNHRSDEYGGNASGRFRILHEVIVAVKEVWDGPLLVRLSATDHHVDGVTMEDMLWYCKQLKELGIDLIDVSTGGSAIVPIELFPGYQVQYAEEIKNGADIATGTVGLITTGTLAEEILQKNRADLIFIGRELLRDPYWPRSAAQQLAETIEAPEQYSRGW